LGIAGGSQATGQGDRAVSGICQSINRALTDFAAAARIFASILLVLTFAAQPDAEL
jgi:hypothetical protein